MSVQKYFQMREKWLKKFVKFLNPDAVVKRKLRKKVMRKQMRKLTLKEG